MICTEKMDGAYKTQPLVTLKEAKAMYPYIKYLDWLDESALGVVSTYSFYEEFLPVTYKGEQLKATKEEG